MKYIVDYIVVNEDMMIGISNLLINVKLKSAFILYENHTVNK